MVRDRGDILGELFAEVDEVDWPAEEAEVKEPAATALLDELGTVGDEEVDCPLMDEAFLSLLVLDTVL